ncbi:NUDIX hydrolase [Alkalicoccobacillus plakortidis]|uniref:NUDIX hydrolase n=1 Tax=Alkalicoccobacillus plakortidis TaxID=444060 RepID=A0ABT0XN08_9BACI|nr:NUDIX hydrolase [Alkalicoccobacillus plakortidis]MCM2677100.1 NUDIX hydrolase [Alkalicoccobacillus plakortidis]
METEELRIFNKQGETIGVKPRSIVHEHGFWHETFHCWMIGSINNTYYVDLQFRSPDKKDFPSKFDISAAGHLLSHESKKDGVRELHEEIGIKATFDELISVGTLSDTITTATMIDNEFCHVFLYSELPKRMDEYQVQTEEVGGMFRVPWSTFKKVLNDPEYSVVTDGFLIKTDQTIQFSTQPLTKNNLVPHSDSYFQTLIKAVDLYIATSQE